MSTDSAKLRCAVIGLGMGKGHAKHYAENPDAELVGIVDLDENRLKQYESFVSGPSACFTDYKEMLKQAKPELVSVALPNFLHAPVAIDCLNAGCHVLGEKPMAMYVSEAKQIRDAADKAGKRFGLNLSYRFSPPARALKDMAAGGLLGDVYHAYTRWTRLDGFPGFGGWFGQKGMSGGGPLIDLGVHRLDLALWLMGSPQPVTVSGCAHHKIGVPRAQKAGKKFDVEDFATGFVRLKGGASLIFEISWGGFQEQKEMMRTVVMGDQGALIQRNFDGGYGFMAEIIKEEAGHVTKAELTLPRGDIRNPYNEMVHCVRNDMPYLASAEDGIRIQQILDGLYESAEKGHEIEVDLDG
ncbi:MAG: Gfo/Idh/MocA family protein [Opitutales bacterium]